MDPLDLDKLTPEQRAMVALWEAHMKAEFQDNDTVKLSKDGDPQSFILKRAK